MDVRREVLRFSGYSPSLLAGAPLALSPLHCDLLSRPIENHTGPAQSAVISSGVVILQTIHHREESAQWQNRLDLWDPPRPRPPSAAEGSSVV